MVSRLKEKSQQTKSFLIDNYRNLLILKKDFDKLIKTYEKDYVKILNLNTKNLWDTKFDQPENIDHQDSMTREKINFIVSQLPAGPLNILDLGIGQGYLEQRLKQLKIRHNLYGIDISEKSINRSKKRFRGKFKIGNVTSINNYYPNNFFDIIVAIEVLEHISTDKILNLYKKIHKKLKKNGLFIISTPLNEGLTEHSPNPSAHVRLYTIPILRFEFEYSKFTIKKIKTLYAFNNNYFIKKNLSKIITNRWKPNNVIIVAEKK